MWVGYVIILFFIILSILNTTFFTNRCSFDWLKAKGSTSNMRQLLMSRDGPHKIGANGPTNYENGVLVTGIDRQLPVRLKNILLISITYCNNFYSYFICCMNNKVYSEFNLRFYIIKWIVNTNKPFDEVSYSDFWEMFLVSNPSVKPFSRATVKRDIELMHQIGEGWICSVLKVGRCINNCLIRSLT